MPNSQIQGDKTIKTGAETKQNTNEGFGTLDAESQSPTGSVAGYCRRIGNFFEKTERWLVKYNLEARGIQRVEPHERHDVTWISYLQAFQLWFSINLAAINSTLGMLAPVVFGLSFKDASLCAVFGSLIGSSAVAYIAPFGPISGLRSMVRGNPQSTPLKPSLNSFYRCLLDTRLDGGRVGCWLFSI